MSRRLFQGGSIFWEIARKLSYTYESVEHPRSFAGRTKIFGREKSKLSSFEVFELFSYGAKFRLFQFSIVISLHGHDLWFRSYDFLWEMMQGTFFLKHAKWLKIREKSYKGFIENLGDFLIKLHTPFPKTAMFLIFRSLFWLILFWEMFLGPLSI